MVRLKEKWSLEQDEFDYYFNSSVVRLKVNGEFEGICRILPFQFQCGAIKRNLKNAYFKYACYFNSSVVRLKEYAVASASSKVFNFNSSVVRLKVVLHTLCSILPFYFNSSVVRLKGKSK